MSGMPVAEPMTARRFLALGVPEGGRPWNLVGGEVVLSEPTPLHQEVQGNLLFALESWARATSQRGRVSLQRGRVSLPRDVVLDETNVFAPDILWYREGRVPDVHAAPPSPMPDLAVEIRSASNWRYDLGAKQAGYERRGLPELWLVDTVRRIVLVYRRSGPEGAVYDPAEELGGSDELTSPQLAGFGVRVDLLFP